LLVSQPTSHCSFGRSDPDQEDGLKLEYNRNCQLDTKKIVRGLWRLQQQRRTRSIPLVQRNADRASVQSLTPTKRHFSAVLDQHYPQAPQ
jgi:hypothetical protein